MIVRRLLGLLSPPQLIALSRWQRPDSEFLLSEDQRLTRRQVFAQVEALAAGLQALGVGKGDRVVTLLPACPEAVYALFLPWWLGNIEVPLNPFYRRHELRHILADCGAQVVITTRQWAGQDYAALLEPLRAELPQLTHILVREAGGGDGERVLSVPEVMARGRAWQGAAHELREIGRLSYTSGTTGLPKGVVHTRVGYWGLARRGVSERLDLSLLRCLLLPFPPYHYAGWLGIVGALLAGGKVVLWDRFNPQAMLECIQRERVSQIGGSPTMYRLLLQTPGQERYDLSSVRRLTLGTEPCPEDLALALHERFHCHLENMYGLTECGMVSWTGPDDPWEQVAKTVGRLAPGSRVRIVDDARQPVPGGHVGEIAVQTTQMMAGYYRDPGSTAEVIDETGWLYTGDMGCLGQDGYLRLVDRKKDLVIRGGQNIYPAEVERYLERHPAIRRAAVLGVPNAVTGELLWAYLEPQAGAQLSPQEVWDWCRGQIAAFKTPEQVRFVEHLPTTGTGKVKKFELREWALAEEGEAVGKDTLV